MSDTSAQVDSIMKVMESAFDPAYGEAWNRRQVRDGLAMPSTYALVIDAQGREVTACEPGSSSDPAGFVLTRAAAGEEELLLIAVDPECRRRGLGSMLMEHLFEQAHARGTHRIFLEMRRGNPAGHLYRAFGFEPIGKRADYYRLTDGSRVDAITFGKRIS